MTDPAKKPHVLAYVLAAIWVIYLGAARAAKFTLGIAFAALIFALIFRWLGVTIVTP